MLYGYLYGEKMEIGKIKMEKMGIKIPNNESTQKLWGVIDGKIIEIKKYDNESIRQYILQNGKIMKDISKMPYTKNLDLTPSMSILTIGKTSISGLNNKYKSKYHAIRYLPPIFQKFKGNGVERQEYFDNTLIINPKIIKDILKYARYLDIIQKIHYKKPYDKHEIIDITIKIIKHLKEIYKNNHKSDRILYYENVLNIIRHYPERKWKINNINTHKPKYLIQYKKPIRFIEEKKEYPKKPKGRKPRRKKINFKEFKKLIEEGKLSQKEFRNYIVLN